jgi:hypothetical protein
MQPKSECDQKVVENRCPPWIELQTEVSEVRIAADVQNPRME